MPKFLDEFLGDPGNEPTPGHKQTLHHDKWDMEDWQAILDEMRELSLADDALTAFTPTGHEAMGDTWFALVKANPKLRKAKDIRPSYLVNRAVEAEVQDLKEYKELRTYAEGDIVAAGLACTSMEPDLEVLFDKLKQESEQAEAIEGLLGQQGQAEDDKRGIDEIVKDLMESDGDEGEIKNYQEQSSLLADAIDKLKQQISEATGELQQNLKDKAPMMRDVLRHGMNEAIEEAAATSDMSNFWGLEHGNLQRLPAERRVELAKRMKSDKFKRLAKIIGPLTRLAIAEQRRKVKYARDEIYGLELGNDLNFVLPQEMLYLADPFMEYLFYQKYFDAGLVQFKLQGTERVAKGGIIFCEDGSGSMGGDREVWAKAVGLALLQIARMQKREFYGIHFGSPGEYATFDFDLKNGSVDFAHGKTAEHYDMVDGVLFFAELFFGGGTDYHTPLSVALAKLQDQHARFGGVQGDIVFVTDDECGLDAKFLAMFKEEQARLGFRVFGIAIDCNPKSEPLYSMCDGRVVSVKSLVAGPQLGDDIRDIFGSI